MASPDRPRPRVVFVDHVARLSGAEIALLRLLPALRRHVDAHVILGEEGPLVAKLEAIGIATEVLPMPERLRDLRKGTVRPGRLDMRALAELPGYILRLRRRLRELDADIVHTNTLKAALYGGAAARLAAIPAVWHVRDRIAPDYLPASAVRLVRTAAYILPSAVVANSRATLDTLPSVRRSRVLYNPVVPDAVELPQRDRRQATDKLSFGVIGRLASWKGQHVFLAAFAHAFKGTAVRGRIIGSALFGEDAYAASLVSLARELGVEEQIDFRGFQEDVWEELAQLDVLVHCSISPEPFGQVVLEGLASGLPVVAAAAGGPAELITDGVDGLLTPPGDANALAAALRRLVDDPELGARLGDAGRKRSESFTPATAAAQLLEVYRGIGRRER